ncbi:tRNA (guanosine(37)-N1)-methyltransferase TrmD [Candidatus Gottesmanbacteria bacterium RIFCSPLOWO2_01_FULL_46_9]|uniref:tRNA (guanine-N(1)-)-methyltransferase n=1 Tax=Candidatus Gottesmanbacteria bacterium RIFCSPLOWO2_01_FULL_46_9 TaxID=1798394 RepID=A0A1F6B1H9_9BACT|nr:MAG: tRNA (guanosine(37)-N1)-methyltransferase TrmD [Candidatus Gottesmanbacteria bacterium RIFCSPLOWO2_01_FULL_46_9]
MQITILTLFPEMFAGPFDHSIIKRASDKRLITIAYLSIRSFATDAYKTVDDHPYGGGHGMILRVDVVDRAIEYAKARSPNPSHTVLLDPQGTPYTQGHASRLRTNTHLILICGHYEGIDERIRTLVDEELSIGDYILTGGELPAMVIVDSVVRLLPGVLKKEEAKTQESFSQKVPALEYPQYTRPETYKGMKVPSPLLSGNHKKIAAWKEQQSQARTRLRRPDLLIKKPS